MWKSKENSFFPELNVWKNERFLIDCVVVDVILREIFQTRRKKVWKTCAKKKEKFSVENGKSKKKGESSV